MKILLRNKDERGSSPRRGWMATSADRDEFSYRELSFPMSGKSPIRGSENQRLRKWMSDSFGEFCIASCDCWSRASSIVGILLDRN